MSSFGMLYQFELKKLWQKKMARFTFVILLGIVILMNISDLLFATHRDETGREMSAWEYIRETKAYARKISGRVIDHALIVETQKAYGDREVIVYKESEEKNDAGLTTTVGAMIGSVQREDGRKAEEILEDHKKYKEIYSYLVSVIGYIEVQDIDEDGFYRARQDRIEETCLDGQNLRERELSLWLAREEQLEKPFVYEYCEGFTRLFWQMNLLNYLWIFLCAICLSGIFSEEHLRKTDQLIFCSRYGRFPFYLAKLCAGVTFILAGMVIFYLAAALLSLGIYGTDGFHAGLQMYLWKSSWEISIGGAVLCLFFLSLTAAVLCSVVTMFLSELFKNGIAALAVMAGGTLLTVFVNVPARFRVFSMLYSLLPTKLVQEQGFIDNRRFFILGHGISGLEMAPWLYLLAAAGIFRAGYRLYQRYQAGGR